MVEHQSNVELVWGVQSCLCLGCPHITEGQIELNVHMLVHFEHAWHYNGVLVHVLQCETNPLLMQ